MLVAVVVLVALLGLLTTCVVVAQTGNYRSQQLGDDPSAAPERASMSDNGGVSPENSGPPATPWQKVRWQKAAKKNQIIGVEMPPNPAARKARQDPLRVSVALLAAIDSTNPAAWRPGQNPLRGYMSPALDRVYTPPKGEGEEAEDPGDNAAKKLPAGATASYEFYCHVASHAKAKVVSQCAFHVRTTKADKTLRDEDGVEQLVTAKHTDGGWRVTRIEPAAESGGD